MIVLAERVSFTFVYNAVGIGYDNTVRDTFYRAVCVNGYAMTMVNEGGQANLF